MVKDVKIPEISENVTSGSIVEVLVAVGDTVVVDDVLVEMETEKAVVEIPSPYAGKISEVLVKAGDEKNVGDVIVRIEVSDADTEGDEGRGTEGETPSEEDAGKSVSSVESGEEDKEPAEKSDVDQASQEKSDVAASYEETESQVPEKEAEAESTDSKVDDETPPAPAAPSVRRMARELGVDIHDVHGSGLDGRISQEDVHAYVKQRLSCAPAGRDGASGGGSAAGQPSLPDFSRWGTIRTEKLATVRRLTAENTSASWRIVPQVTQFDEADITDVQTFLDQHSRKAEQKGGKLTLTAVLMKICAVALKRYPGFNASIDPANDQMIFKDYVHIGMAVDTPRGLLVPVIRDVQDKGIIDLAVEIVDTARRARDKKVKPEEFEGASFTISNQGGIGGTAFTPVVVWPQAAILGISRAQKRLVERDEDIVSRTILPLCVSYDHRIVDGADAARFLDFICRSLEQGLTILL
jgi:pyruvate dehydrogenase E2 component (dihydrolipoamide acetyltransferase)